jgi:hypothetical protein
MPKATTPPWKKKNPNKKSKPLSEYKKKLIKELSIKSEQKEKRSKRLAPFMGAFSLSLAVSESRCETCVAPTTCD